MKTKNHISGLNYKTMCGRLEKYHRTDMLVKASCEVCIKAEKSLSNPSNHNKWLEHITDGAKQIRKRNRELYGKN